jgi:hypothetical protein
MRGGVGGGEELAHEHQELKARPGVGLERRGGDRRWNAHGGRGGGEEGLVGEGFPVRKAAKFWSSSCSRRRESYWGGWIGRRRGGGMGSMGTEAHR